MIKRFYHRLAMGGYIEPKDMGYQENYELIVEYWPQRLPYIGLIIPGVTLLGCLMFLSYNFYNRRKSKSKDKEGKGMSKSEDKSNSKPKRIFLI
ncbi:MAG: hypothetical protein ACYDIA_18245 [Candidatus Humimicrobiaceae bacterium]